MFVSYDAEGVAEVMGLNVGRTTAVPPRGFQEQSRRPVGGLALSEWDDADHAVRVTAGSSSTPISIEKAVEQGLHRAVLRHVAERIAGGDKTKASAVEWGVVPKTTLDRRADRLSPQESERTERVARLFVHARRALGSEDEARVFVTSPHPELDGRSPLEAARTDLGTRRAEQILNALEYGLAL